MSEPRETQSTAPVLTSDAYWRGEDGRNCAPTLSLDHPQRRHGASSTNVVGAPRGGDVYITGGTVHSANTINFTHIHHYTDPPAPTQAPSIAQDPSGKLKAMTNTTLWISALDISSKRAPKTGQIFLSGEKFQGWFVLPRSVLWASGDPGAGKTFLASAIYDAVSADVHRSPNDACTIIYLKDNDQWTTWDIVSCIIIDLVESNPLPAALDAIHQTLTGKRHSNGRPSLPDLVALLQTVVKLYGRCYVLIDGLDEMKDEIQAELIRVIAELEANVLLTSRVLKLVQDKLAEIAPVKPVFITFAAQAEDLELFINETIDRTPTFWGLLNDSFPKKRLIEKIQTNARGMFLHAALQMEALRHCIDQQELIDMLDQFPPGIDALYADTVKRIERQPPSHVSRAKIALIWLAHANGVLTINDLRCATATFAPDYRVELTRQLTEDNLLTICCGLVTLDPETRQVRLIHATARDALRSILQNACPKPHVMIATACMARLVEFGFHQCWVSELSELEDLYAAGPLLRYAHRAIQHHAQEGVREHPAFLSRVDQFIQRCTSFPYQDPVNSTIHGLTSLHIATLFNQQPLIAQLLRDGAGDVNVKTRHRSGGLSPLAIAASEGLDDMTNFLLTFSDIHPNDGDLTPLMCAVIHGREAVMKQLLRHFGVRSGQVNRSGRGGDTALTFAAWKGRTGVVKLLLACNGIDVNLSEQQGVSPLHIASGLGHIEVVKLLLNTRGINVNQTMADGATPLYIASYKGHVEAVKLLLGVPGINVNQSNTTGTSPLHIASGLGHVDLVKLLLDSRGININRARADGATPLYIASYKGHLEVAKLLFNVPGIDVNQSNATGISPLHIASELGHVNIVKLLTNARHFDINRSNADGATPLYIASEKGHAEVVKLLLTVPAISVGYSPLHIASTLGHVEVVKLLLDVPGININQRMAGGTTALYVASEKGHIEVVKLLLDASGIDINQSMADGGTPLYVACEKGHVEVVKLLLNASESDIDYNDAKLLRNAPRIDINKRTAYGTTALYIASHRGHVEVVKLLTDLPSINVNQSSRSGASPLYVAAQNGHVQVVKLLLKVPTIDINLRRSGASALYVAAQNSRIEVVSALLNEPGIDINLSKTAGASPLYIACQNGDVEMVKLQVNHPAIDINQSGSHGVSPLIVSSHYGHRKVVKALLDIPGINLVHQDAYGNTALTAASRQGDRGVVKALSTALANSHIEDLTPNTPSDNGYLET